jgi:hypothetical protein
MAAASSRRPPFRTAEYWAALEAIADDLINETVPHGNVASGTRAEPSRGCRAAALVR